MCPDRLGVDGGSGLGHEVADELIGGLGGMHHGDCSCDIGVFGEHGFDFAEFDA